jgi:hypothetical protein
MYYTDIPSVIKRLSRHFVCVCACLIHIRFIICVDATSIFNDKCVCVKHSSQVRTIVHADICCQTLYIFGKQIEYSWGGEDVSFINIHNCKRCFNNSVMECIIVPNKTLLFINSNLTATFVVCFEKFSGPPKEFIWDTHSLRAASVTCLDYFIILSEPLS